MSEAKRPYLPRAEYFPTPMNPWSFLRALIPLRQSLDNPLVVFQIRRGEQVGRNPWILLMTAYCIVIFEILYLVGVLVVEDIETLRLNDLLLPMLGILMFCLSLGAVYGHWRLMLAIFLRIARVVTERRQNGDWDLIAITPMPKARWLQAQLVALGWQVWPLVRNLIILQTLLSVILYGFAVYQIETEFGDNGIYEDPQDPLPISIYTIAVLPMLAGMVAEPIFFMGLLTAVAFYVSTISKQPAMAILYNFLGTFLARSVISAVFFYGGAFFTLFFLSFTGEMDLSGFDGSAFIGFILYTCIGIPVSSFFIELMPPFGPIMMAIEADALEHFLIYLTILCTGVTAYIITPLVMIRTLTDSTLSRLQRRER